jgi:hypothetical protein
VPIPDPNTVEVCGGVTSQPASGSAVWGGEQLQIAGGSYIGNVFTRGAPLNHSVDSESGAVVAVADIRADAVTISANRGFGLSTPAALSVRRSWIHANDEGLNGNTVETDGVTVNQHKEWGIRGSTVTLANTAVLGNSINPTMNNGTSGGVWAETLRATNVTIAENDGFPLSASTAALVNTTLVAFSGEFADSSSRTPYLSTSLELHHATVVGIVLTAPQLTTSRSVVIAPPDSSVCAAPDGVTPVAVTSKGYNWFSDTSCGLRGTGDRQGAAAFALGALARNGGDIQTMLPGPGSVLIDRIPTRACTLASDARGVTRPQGSGCDIGAAEVAAP